MDLTLGEAAKAAKRSKQALSAAIKKGRLSATKDANGVWHVDTAELLRVYPDAKCEVGDGGRGLAGLATTDNAADPAEVAALRARVAALEEMRRAADMRADELRRERDAWQQQAERLLLALPAGKAEIRPPDAPEPETRHITQEEAQKPKKRGFWRSFFGGGGERDE